MGEHPVLTDKNAKRRIVLTNRQFTSLRFLKFRLILYKGAYTLEKSVCSINTE
ncbi:hypothetical protein EMIT0180MI3_10306 [Priestia megaterium]